MARGREVAIEGRTGIRESSAIVIGTALTDLGPSVQLAQRVSASDLASASLSYRYVEAVGIVHSARIENDGRFTLNVADADGMFQARVLGSGPAVGQSLIDARVRIRGVADTTFNTRGQAVRLQILVSGLDDIQVDEAGPSRSVLGPRAVHRQPAPSVAGNSLGTSRAGAGHDHPASGRHVVD